MNNVAADSNGNEFDLRPISCPTCSVSSERFVGMRGGKFHRYGLGIETRIVQCLCCGLLFPNPFPFPRNPQELYGDPDKYFENHVASEKIENNRGIIRRARELAAQPPRRLLDVGSGRGEMLIAARLEGMEALGIEFSDAMIHTCQERHGLKVEKTAIEDLHAPSFDLIVLNAVLEHVYDPDAMIASVARLSSPGALLYVDVPHEPNLVSLVGNALNRLRGDEGVYNLQPTWSPFHVFGFNRKAITTLLTKHGFEIKTLSIWAAPDVPAKKNLKDQIMAFSAKQLIKLGNLTGSAPNMCLFAVKRASAT